MAATTTSDDTTTHPLYFIGDATLAAGFALAGLRNAHAYREGLIDELKDKLREDGGILAVSNKYAGELEAELEALRIEGIITVIVPDETGGEDRITSHLAKGGMPTNA